MGGQRRPPREAGTTRQIVAISGGGDVRLVILVERATIRPVAFVPFPPTFLALFAIVFIVEIITIAIHVSPRGVVQAKFAIERGRGQDAGSVGGEGAAHGEVFGITEIDARGYAIERHDRSDGDDRRWEDERMHVAVGCGDADGDGR